jgi:hypothetical protein
MPTLAKETRHEEVENSNRQKDESATMSTKGRLHVIQSTSLFAVGGGYSMD